MKSQNGNQMALNKVALVHPVICYSNITRLYHWLFLTECVRIFLKSPPYLISFDSGVIPSYFPSRQNSVIFDVLGGRIFCDNHRVLNYLPIFIREGIGEVEIQLVWRGWY